MDDAFGDDRTEAVQWYANTYGGVHADNTFENCNEEKDGALSAAGECYHGAGPNMFLEFLNNTMVNSGGITVANRAQVKYTDAVCNATGRANYGGNVSRSHASERASATPNPKLLAALGAIGTVD